MAIENMAASSENVGFPSGPRRASTLKSVDEPCHAMRTRHGSSGRNNRPHSEAAAADPQGGSGGNSGGDGGGGAVYTAASLQLGSVYNPLSTSLRHQHSCCASVGMQLPDDQCQYAQAGGCALS